MSIPKNLLSTPGMLGFTLPKLHKGKTWYVDFSSWDPVQERMRRKKYMLDKYETPAAKTKVASVLIANITQHLLQGWNPWVSGSETRHFTPVEDALGKYKEYVKMSESKGILKHKTAYDYLSRLNIFREYVDVHPIKYTYEIDSSYVLDFLDYLLLDRDVSATTRNSYRTWLSTFGTWLKLRKYIADNPATDIKSLPESVKYRQPLTPRDLGILSGYLREHNKSFLLACMFAYYTLIRPDEMGHIKLKDISIKNQTVFVSQEISKNRRDGMVALNDSIIKLMIELHVFDFDNDCYLFGKNLRPSREKIAYNKLRQVWSKTRLELGFPDYYQFYSLKDSGIRDLIASEGAYAARNQARHSDLQTTNRYAQDFSVSEETKHFKGKL